MIVMIISQVMLYLHTGHIFVSRLLCEGILTPDTVIYNQIKCRATSELKMWYLIRGRNIAVLKIANVSNYRGYMYISFTGIYFYTMIF